jgi:intracellular septation protein
MTPLIDFLPLIAFVIAYWLFDFKMAIIVIMIAVVVQVIATWILTRTVKKMLLASAALVVGLGAISLLLQNDLIFKWKPTVLNWLFAAIFFGSQFIGDKTIVQRVLQSATEDEFQLVPRDWQTLNLMWVSYFIVAGAANIIVAYSFSEGFWVNFKIFGLGGMTLAFIFLQALWMAQRSHRHSTDIDEEKQETE